MTEIEILERIAEDINSMKWLLISVCAILINILIHLWTKKDD